MKAEYIFPVLVNENDYERLHITAEAMPGNRVKLGYESPTGESGFYIFPVKAAPGFAIKINRSSIGTDSGTAESLVKSFCGGCGDTFLAKAISYMIFQNPNRERYAA